MMPDEAPQRDDPRSPSDDPRSWGRDDAPDGADRRAEVAAYQRERRRRVRAEGVLCPRCCIRAHRADSSLCGICRARMRVLRARSATKRAHERDALALELALASDAVAVAAGRLTPRRPTKALDWARAIRDGMPDDEPGMTV